MSRQAFANPIASRTTIELGKCFQDVNDFGSIARHRRRSGGAIHEHGSGVHDVLDGCVQLLCPPHLVQCACNAEADERPGVTFRAGRRHRRMSGQCPPIETIHGQAGCGMHPLTAVHAPEYVPPPLPVAQCDAVSYGLLEV